MMHPSNHDRPWTVDHFETRSDSPNNTLPNKNTKNLSINMNTVTLARPATSNGVEGRQPFSEPTSPYKEPLRSARKKPTNLTIRTPGFNQLSFPRNLPDVPPTPSSKPPLQTFQSSPSLQSSATPTTSSSGGLHLSLPSFGSGHSRPGSDSSFSSQSTSGQLTRLKEEEEAHKSQETQEQGYPDGPVLIYDCGLYLYLEPTAEEASQFDTVINVAKEVKNPFQAQTAGSQTVVSILREESNRPITPEPQTAISEISFKSAWEYQPLNAPTPTTPRPESSLSRREPEYLHVAWDHNSEILHDLFPLCQLIDDRVTQGKKVLVHCQLGVSRSASLVIAFGLYKGYQPDFHSMYMQVKTRSEWVGPNMTLIYQLTDFRRKITEGEYDQNSRAPPTHWFQNSAVASPAIRTPFQSLSLRGPSQEAVETYTGDSVETPQTIKPLRSLRLDKELPPVPLFPKDGKPVSHIVNQFALPSVGTERTQPKVPILSADQIHKNVPKKRLEPRPLPFRKLAEFSNPQTIPPHRPREAVPPLLQIMKTSSQMDLASRDVPQTPSLFSPRATEFMASPFGISSCVGDLAANGPRSARSVRSISPPAQDLVSANVKAESSPVPSTVDPRSPHQQSDGGEILRHIDDFL
jgi:tyrosine-protein phosphatase MSG5